MQVRKGNIVLFDNNETRRPAEPIIRGMVVGTESDKILFQGGFNRKTERCAGIILNESWLNLFAFRCVTHGLYERNGITWDIYDRVAKYKNEVYRCEFVHDLQNFYQDKTGKMLEVEIRY